jgi:DNA-directed RNA polymerase subunit beta
VDKSKKIRAPYLFYSFGIDPSSLIEMYGDTELMQESIRKANDALKRVSGTSIKLKKEQVDDEAFIRSQKAREHIFKILNTGDRLTLRSTYNLMPGILFNKRRYDLSETGRYKLNQKLSIVDRLHGLTLSEDILDNKDKVILSKGTTVGSNEMDILQKHYDNGTFKEYKVPVAVEFIDNLTR